LTQRASDQLLSEKQNSVRFVKRYLHKNGSVVWVDVVTSLRRDAEKKPLYFLTSIIDITERKRAEEELRSSHEHLEALVRERTGKLEDANKELESFSYSVSHDLRTPLRAIDGFCHILMDDYSEKLDDEGKRLLNVVRDNTQKMGQLIDDILAFSRTGRVGFSFSEIDMEGLARAVVEELKPSGGNLHVEIETIPPSVGDHAMMHQVFVNLLSNAIKFSRRKENAIIKVGGSIQGNEAVYFVKDNGAGFDMKYVDKLFGVFQRLHAVNDFEGTGIGLAIVKRIITRHGGRVWAEGQVNEGATIYFALPTKETNNE
jgi:light-regulated signal transduction histidine kinase (bacteriophytochrome)